MPTKALLTPVARAFLDAVEVTVIEGADAAALIANLFAPTAVAPAPRVAVELALQPKEWTISVR